MPSYPRRRHGRRPRSGSDRLTRIVRAEAEPLDPGSLARLETFTRGAQDAVRATFGSVAGVGIPEARKGFREALRTSGMPSAATVTKRAIEALESGLPAVEDLALTFAVPVASLVEYELKVKGVGLFRLDTSLGKHLSLAEVTLTINPLPPPTIIATLRIARAFDEVREDSIDSLT